MLAITPACSKRDGAGGRDSNIDYWTCTMHPSVHAKDPGKCPICSMDLVPVMKESATPARSSKNAPQHDHAAMLAGKIVRQQHDFIAVTRIRCTRSSASNRSA